jgi:hypothetical protein
MKKPNKKIIHAVHSLTPGVPAVPMTPGLSKEERKAMWAERMPWPANYTSDTSAPRSRRTPLGEAAALWV